VNNYKSDRISESVLRDEFTSMFKVDYHREISTQLLDQISNTSIINPWHAVDPY
jgi:hypothetical protein